MFAEFTELQFIEDCCNFTLNPDNGSKYEFMRETFQQFIQGKHNILISQNPQILVSCIEEKLKSSKINPAVYLVKTKYMLNELEGKPWYELPEINTLVKQLRDLIESYLPTVLIYPNYVSPQRVLSDREKEQNQEIFQVIARLFELFEQVNFDDEIFTCFIKSITTEYESKIVHIRILQFLRFYVQKLHIFDSLQLYWNVILYYFKNAQLKQQIFNGEIALWNVQIGRAEQLEIDFILGPLLQISVLQDNKYVIERAHSSFKGKITQKTFQNLLKQYQQTNQEHIEKLVEIFKLCLVKDYFPKTIQFFQAVCNVNKTRTVEKYSQLLKQRQFLSSSSNGFLLSIFDVMLSLSNKISSRTDSTYEKIDEKFWLTLPFEGETMFISSKNALVKQNIQIGNVSYLFFYTLKLLQVCFLPILIEFKQSLKHLDELKEQQELVKGTDMEQRLQVEKEQTEMKVHQLELCLFNPGRIRDIVQLLDTSIFLLDKWINLSKLVDGQYQWQPTELFSYLPEFLINNVFQFHESFLQYYQGYSEFLTPQKFINVIRLGIYLIHLPITQNKYLAGNFIEMIYLYTKQSSKNLNLSGIFCSDELIKQNLLIGLLNQFYFVGATGANNQFYAKFSYRYYINDLLITLFKFPFYQQQFQKYRNTEDCHKLINALVGDMNYGFEELWTNYLTTYKKIKEEIPKNQQEKMQQQSQLQQCQSQCKANLQNFKSNLKILVELSQYIPDVLTNDVFSKQIIPQLNYYLRVWMIQDSDTKAKLELLKEVSEKKFKLIIIFQEIGHFFANISHIQKAVDTLLEDNRSFHIDNFRKLESILRTNIAGQQDKVEKLQQLVQQLQSREEDEKIVDTRLSKEMEPPDNFQDPLTSEVMKDPVMLPQSKTIIDRNSIRLALLEKPIDPYTNTPLKIEDVIPQPELKAKIQDWLKKYNERKQILLQERKKNKIQTEPPLPKFELTGNFQDDDDDQNQQFKGRKYDDE